MGAIDVLVVEDSPEIRDLVRSSLGLDPTFSVVGEAGDPIEALPLVSEHQPDVVLLDLAMPRMGGLEAIDHVRRASPASAIVIHSSLLEKHQGPRARALGADAYLEKGSSIDKMRDTLRSAARLRAAECRATDDSQRRLETIVGSASDAIVAWSLDARITDWNPAAERLYGYTPAEAIGGTIDLFTPPERRAAARARQLRVMEAGATESLEVTRITKDGREIMVAVTASPMRDARGEIVGAMGISRDITEERRQRLELERSNTELEQFAYVASHDLQEPLGVIAGFVELLRDRYDGQLDEDADRFIAATLAGVNRMSRLIDDLLAYSRVGRSELVREEIDTGELVARTLEGSAASLTERGIDVRCGELPAISGDPGMIGQVFQNLLSNAIKFTTAERPRIEISGAESSRGWRFVVADDGDEIDPENRERIFEMFQRLHGRAVPGTGIGLAVCQRIVERHGGRIWVEPAADGGNAFVFELSS